MRWRGWLTVIAGYMPCSMGATLLIFGHAWRPKQEPCQTSEYCQTFQHDGGNVPQISAFGTPISESIAGMKELWPFIEAVGRHWWALMSCAIFTGLGVFIAWGNKSNMWAVEASIAAAVICVFIACYLAWRDERKGVLKSEAERNKIQKMYEDQRPILGLNLVGTEGMKAWMETNIPVHFAIQHLSGRVATSVRFDPIISKLGKYALQFDAIAHVDPPVQKVMTYDVQDVGHISLGYRDRDRIGNINSELLRHFVLDSPEEENDWEYPLVAHFKDVNEEQSQIFHLRFDRRRFRFLRNTSD
jgi:hypothetical protein